MKHRGGSMTLGMGMSLVPALRSEGRQVQRLSLEQIGEHPIQRLLRIWEYSPHHTISLGDGTHIEFVLCADKHLEAVIEGEQYGVYLGEKIFVSTKTPERWIPFVALHEWAERQIGEHDEVDDDPTGRAKHWQAIRGEIRTAAFVLSEAEFDMYLSWRISVEKTQYFQLDQDVQKYLADRASRLRLAPPVSSWTRRSMRHAATKDLVGYDDAHAVGASHCDLIFHELSDGSCELGDLYALLSFIAYRDLREAVAVPTSFQSVIHLLATEISHPILSVDRESETEVWIRHISGRTRLTVEAMMRRLAQAQQKELALPNDTRPSLPTLSGETRERPRSLEPHFLYRPQPRLLTNTLAEEPMLIGFLCRILSECVTGADLDRLLDTYDREEACTIQIALTLYCIGVPPHARDIDLLNLGSIADILAREVAFLPEEIDGRTFFDPRPEAEVIRANVPLFEALAAERRVLDLWLFVADHCDREFDAVPWILRFLAESVENELGEEVKVISKRGSIRSNLLVQALFDGFGLELNLAHSDDLLDEDSVESAEDTLSSLQARLAEVEKEAAEKGEAQKASIQRIKDLEAEIHDENEKKAFYGFKMLKLDQEARELRSKIERIEDAKRTTLRAALDSLGITPEEARRLLGKSE